MVLMLRPQSGYGQWVIEQRYNLSTRVPVTEYMDSYGNLCQRLTAPKGRFVVSTGTVAETSPTIDVEPGAPLTLVQNLPDYALQFLLPSRYCPSDQVGDLASEIIKDVQPGYDQVAMIQDWIHDNIEYQYGASNPSTWALDTIRDRKGVCRDFSHLAISLCRFLSIPARMVVGYLHKLDPMDLHAWFEAFVNGRWYTFDATQERSRGGRIAIAYGRDAADVALATQFGPAPIKEMKVWVKG